MGGNWFTNDIDNNQENHEIDVNLPLSDDTVMSEDSDDEEWDSEDLIQLSRLNILLNIEWGINNQTYWVQWKLQTQAIKYFTPYNLFKLLMTDEIIVDMEFQTNLYAEHIYQNNGKA